MRAINQRQPLPLPLRSPAGSQGRNRRRRKAPHKTYTRKGKRLVQRVASFDGPDDEDDLSDDGPLLRPGEGLVVEWIDEAYDAVFESTHSNGQKTSALHSIPILADPELEAKKKALSRRQRNGITLEDCLDEFGREEILSEADTWYCPRCKLHRRASKKFELWKTPDILIMHLKRFSSAQYRRDKLDIYVHFPLTDLDLTSRVLETEEGKQEIYDLFAVDDHWGGLGGGHYTAYAKNWVDDNWYE